MGPVRFSLPFVLQGITAALSAAEKMCLREEKCRVHRTNTVEKTQIWC